MPGLGEVYEVRCIEGLTNFVWGIKFDRKVARYTIRYIDVCTAIGPKLGGRGLVIP